MNHLQPSSLVAWYSPSRLLLPLFVVAMSVYIILRGIYVDFTHDEAYTFLNYLNRPLGATLKVEYTNNHFLNSILARVTYYCFGSSELALRLPNVLAGIAFFVFTARLLCKISEGTWFRLLAFVAITFNAFMLDFFGVCRGYGLSLGLLMASFFYLYISLANKKHFRFEFLALTLTALATLANYTLINLFLLQALFILGRGAYITGKIRNNKREFYLHGLFYLVLTGCVTWFTIDFLKVMLSLNKLGNFDFGGASGFWSDTVGSLSWFSCFPILHNKHWIANWWVPVFAGIMFLVSGVACALIVTKRNWNQRSIFTLFLFYIIVGCVLAIVLQHFLMNVSYSVDRTAIYFIPVFSLLVLIALCCDRKWILAGRIAAALFFLPLVSTQMYNFNLYKTIFWSRDANTDAMTELLIAKATELKSSNGPVIVVVPYEIYPAFRYYLFKSNSGVIQPANYDEAGWQRVADLAVDFYDDSRMPAGFPFREIPGPGDKKIMERMPAVKYGSERLLGEIDFENNGIIKRESAEGYQSKFADRVSRSQQYSLCVVDTIRDSLGGGDMYLFSFWIFAEQLPAHIQAVLSVERKGELKEWKSWDVGEQMRGADSWQHVVFRISPEVDIAYGDQLGFYILQYGEEIVRVDNLKVLEYRNEPADNSPQGEGD